jgi:hypothetical protein
MKEDCREEKECRWKCGERGTTRMMNAKEIMNKDRKECGVTVVLNAIYAMCLFKLWISKKKKRQVCTGNQRFTSNF